MIPLAGFAGIDGQGRRKPIDLDAGRGLTGATLIAIIADVTARAILVIALDASLARVPIVTARLAALLRRDVALLVLTTLLLTPLILPVLALAALILTIVAAAARLLLLVARLVELVVAIVGAVLARALAVLIIFLSLRPALLVEACPALAEDAEIMVGELQVIFGHHAIALHLGVARQRLVFLVELAGVAARAIVEAIAAIRS